MKLKVKAISLTTGGPLIAVIHEKTAKRLNLFPKDRVSIRRLHKNKEINCVADISSGIKEKEVGLFEESFLALGAKEGTQIELYIAERPHSLNSIKRKLDGKELHSEEMHGIVKDIVQNNLSEVELAYFIAACYTEGLTLKESVDLTNALVDNGEVLKFKEKIILDKHCIGGVAGNRTTLIVVPIIASLGYTMPKTSSRAITSPSGTADTMEVIAPVSLSKEKVLKVVKKTKACIVWGGAVDLASADDKLINIRHPVSIDPTGMLLASIMAKKKAAGATHVLIDIPWGLGSKIEKKEEAKALKQSFLKLGKRLGMKLCVVLTDGSQPIGNGIGPALEVHDVIAVLKGGGPPDLRHKAVYLATELLKLAGESNAHNKVIHAIETDLAYEKFKEIIVAQGGRKHIKLPRAEHFFNVTARHAGKVKAISNNMIAQIARLAGAPEDKTAGIYLRVHVGDSIHKGSTLYTVYSNTKENVTTLKKRLKQLDPISY